jgi:hypothetical protein
MQSCVVCVIEAVRATVRSCDIKFLECTHTTTATGFDMDALVLPFIPHLLEPIRRSDVYLNKLLVKHNNLRYGDIAIELADLKV